MKKPEAIPAEDGPRKGAKRRIVHGEAGADSVLFSLGAPYPNPFFSVATLPFSLAYKAHVHLELVNQRDEVLYTFVDAIVPTGNHSVVLDKDALGLQPGIYFVQISFRNITTSSTQRRQICIQ